MSLSRTETNCKMLKGAVLLKSSPEKLPEPTESVCVSISIYTFRSWLTRLWRAAKFEIGRVC